MSRSAIATVVGRTQCCVCEFVCLFGLKGKRFALSILKSVRMDVVMGPVHGFRLQK